MSRSVPVALCILSFLLAGCAQSYYRQGLTASEKGDYDAALPLLYKAVKERPDDSRAWREIGLAWYRTDSLGKAEEAFATSNKISPNAMSNLYLGLIFERTGEIDKAIRVYTAAGNLEGTGQTRKMIRDRLGVLIDKQLTEDARRAVRGEDTLSVESLPQNSIAVINFNGSYLPPDLQPIALGLAEFLAMDLSKISQLKVLERVKINVILDELQLAESKYADVRVAPRLGKLLGSRRLVLGTVTSADKSDFRIDGRLVNTTSGVSSGTQSNEGQLDRFFRVEKQFVFALIDTLGIEISKEERDAIERVPTESFLAFMAFSEGLSFEREGRYDNARESFKDAHERDPGFSQASTLADKMQYMSSYSAESKGGPSSHTKSFEHSVVASMKAEEAEAGLGHVQTINLIDGDFLMSDELYWRYGSWAVAPPGGGPVWKGYGIITIRGNPDAK
jgi:tetratricopeptide (TPR) repeat protein